MDEFEAIRRRYGFEMPETYRVLQSAGNFQPPLEKYLSFYDCEWLPLEEIANFQFNRWEIASDGGFVPFAMTGRHEPYCWRLDWAHGGEPPVVLCERCESARCLAPSFQGFLYRMALEAFAGRNDFLGDSKVDELVRAVNIIVPLLPGDWARRLRDLRDRQDWQTKQERAGCSLFLLAPDECKAILAVDLAFQHLNEEFIHDKEYLERRSGK
jgi:hypothetical protein